MTQTTITPAKTTGQAPIRLNINELAEVFWQLPRREREALEDILEKKFVKTVLRRSKEMSKLRKQKKLLSFKDICQEFLT